MGEFNVKEGDERLTVESTELIGFKGFKITGHRYMEGFYHGKSDFASGPFYPFHGYREDDKFEYGYDYNTDISPTNGFEFYYNRKKEPITLELELEEIKVCYKRVDRFYLTPLAIARKNKLNITYQQIADKIGLKVLSVKKIFEADRTISKERLRIIKELLKI